MKAVEASKANKRYVANFNLKAAAQAYGAAVERDCRDDVSRAKLAELRPSL